MNETATNKNQTPYSAWLQTEILHTLQQTVSDHPGEYAFLINAQVQELYWALIVKEMQAAQACLREDNLVEAHEALLRVVDHHEPLNATWRSLSWITPSDLMPILAAVRATYGRDTALQGWTYRHMVYLFGIKQEQHLEHFEPQPHRFEQLQKALNEPSLYDDVLAFLSRRGFNIPAEVLRRDPSKTYAPDPEVEKVWAAAYETDPPVKMLGETMADIAEEFTTWKYRHLMATRRTIGNRSAYFGTPAVSWLLPTLEEIPFPELFSARTFIGDQPPVYSPRLEFSVSRNLTARFVEQWKRGNLHGVVGDIGGKQMETNSEGRTGAQDLATLVGRVMMSALFLWGGFANLTAAAQMDAYFSSLGLPFPDLVRLFAVAVDLSGGLAVLFGFQAHLAAAGLAVWCIVTALVGHTNFADADAKIQFMKNVAMSGGFIFVAAFGPGAYSLARAWRRPPAIS